MSDQNRKRGRDGKDGSGDKNKRIRTDGDSSKNKRTVNNSGSAPRILDGVPNNGHVNSQALPQNNQQENSYNLWQVISGSQNQGQNKFLPIGAATNEMKVEDDVVEAIADVMGSPAVSATAILPATSRTAISGKIYLDQEYYKQSNPYIWRDPNDKMGSITSIAEKRELAEEFNKHRHKRGPLIAMTKQPGFSHATRNNLGRLVNRHKAHQPIPFTMFEDLDIVQQLKDVEVGGNRRVGGLIRIHKPTQKVQAKIREMFESWNGFRTERQIFNRAQELSKLFARLRQLYGHDDSMDESEPIPISAQDHYLNDHSEVLNRLREIGEFYGGQNRTILKAEYAKAQPTKDWIALNWMKRFEVFHNSSVPYSTHEDCTLIEWHRVRPNQWDVIAEHLPNRIPKSVEHRFRELQRAYDVLCSLSLIDIKDT